MSSRWIAVLVAAASVAVAAPASATPSRGPVAQAACTKAKIHGKTKCLARGQFCTRAYQSDYKRYGFSCSKRDANGRYHLK